MNETNTEHGLKPVKNPPPTPQTKPMKDEISELDIKDKSDEFKEKFEKLCNEYNVKLCLCTFVLSAQNAELYTVGDLSSVAKLSGSVTRTLKQAVLDNLGLLDI